MDSDSDDEFEEDIQALKRACKITGDNSTDDVQLHLTCGAAASGDVSGNASSEEESDGGDNSDLELVRSIHNRFAVPADTEKTLPKTLPPDLWDSDDYEDDYETIRAIERRFSAYSDGGFNNLKDDVLHRPLQVGATVIDSVKDSNSFIERSNAQEGLVNCVDTSKQTLQDEACRNASGSQPFDLVEWDGLADDVDRSPPKRTDFPHSALTFVNAIKKNRSLQKLIRIKMIQTEARIEELRNLRERVKLLKDFQITCKKRTGRALSLKTDARMRLISTPKLRAQSKFSERPLRAVYKGPQENSHVANYNQAIGAFSISINREKWSEKARENLGKGVKQQYQKMLFQQSLDLLCEEDWSDNHGNLDGVISSIKDVDITPEKIRSFLPKVNWEELATMYAPGRSGEECQARFLNCEDPLINHNPWTVLEDKNLLQTVQQRGLSNWIEIAALQGTNRTPFQCLARYQRSLNASILRREWTKEEDDQLRAAVETFGEGNWQHVAAAMEGRAGTQCSNRWRKTLHPTRKRAGKWTADEDKRLKVAVTLFGAKSWKKVASFVPGRTHVQCRERWVNCLDPSLNLDKWTEEEDLKLEAAISEHGYCWSRVAACIPRRTDNQCWRRWKMLFPNEVPQHQKARKIQKAALVSNFVDRESEKPALGPTDFIMQETITSGSKNVEPSRRKPKKTRQKEMSECIEKDDLSGEICYEEIAKLTNGTKRKSSRTKNVSQKGCAKSTSLKNSNVNSLSPHFSQVSDVASLEMSSREGIRRPCDDGNGMGIVEPQKRSESEPKPVGSAPSCNAVPLTEGEAESNSTSEMEAHERIDKDKNTMMTEVMNEVMNDSSFDDSLSLMGIQSAIGVDNGFKVGKRKGKVRETCPGSDCVSLDITDRSVNLTPATIQTETTTIHGHGNKRLSSSEMVIAPCQHSGSTREDTRLQNSDDSTPSNQKDENAVAGLPSQDEDATLASFLLQSQHGQNALVSKRTGKFRGKRKNNFQLEFEPNAVDVPVPDRHKRQRTGDGRIPEVESGSGIDNEGSVDQMLEVGVGDDTTLAQFLNKMKKRRMHRVKNSEIALPS